jgi:NAD(P)-dependent dehydrogenase (short-subunit alcohol dehydrogenase family)
MVKIPSYFSWLLKSIWNENFHEVAKDDLEKVIGIDLKGTFRLSQTAIPLMIKNVSSAGGAR